MNEVVNKFLLGGDKFRPEMHLKQPDFTYSACGPFTKNKEIQITSTRMILVKLDFNMIWLIVNTKIWLKEQYQIKC